jgi:ClpP class serine protease
LRAGKFNLAELYGKIGYGKELISKGRYAQLLADNRPFTQVCTHMQSNVVLLLPFT